MGQSREGMKFMLSWSVHLLRRDPLRLSRIALCLGLVILAGLLVFHNLWLALLPALALLLSVAEFVFPIHYTLSSRAAQARYGLMLLEIRWADVRHAYLTEEGIKLSPLPTLNSRMEGLRGVFLRFDRANQDAVIEAVRRFRECANNV